MDVYTNAKCNKYFIDDISGDIIGVIHYAKKGNLNIWSK